MIILQTSALINAKNIFKKFRSMKSKKNTILKYINGKNILNPDERKN